MILGCDAAGVDEDGNEVVVHAVVSSPDWTGDETLDPRRSLLSERHQGTFAERVVVPRRNVVPKPAALSFEEAACLPTAWLTAYRMLFTQGGLKAGRHGAGPGRRRRRRDRADRARAGRRPAGLRDQPRRVEAGQGARARCARGVRVRRAAAGQGRRGHGDRRPGDLDSTRSARCARAGAIVISGTTSGPKLDDAMLTNIFFLQLSVIGSTMGTRDELAVAGHACSTRPACAR